MEAFLASLWQDIGPALAVFLSAVLTTLGVSIRNKFKEKWIALAYDMAASTAAGWLNTQLHANPPKASDTLNPDDGLGKAAVDVMKAQFPDAVANIEKATGTPMGHGELLTDILGKLGQILPGPGGLAAKVGATVLSRVAAKHK